MSTGPTLSALALLCKRFAADEQGTTAIEYAIIASGVAVAIAATVFSVGSSLQTNFYQSVATAFK